MLYLRAKDMIMTILSFDKQQQFDELVELETLYAELEQAYNSNNKDLMVRAYSDVRYLNIPSSIHRGERYTEIILNEYGRVKTWACDISAMDVDSIRFNIAGRMRVVMEEITHRQQFVELNNNINALYRPGYRYAQNEVIYTNRESNQSLRIDDLLKVMKYATSIAEIIDPNNEDYAKASATISVFQGIENILNGRPDNKPINKMIHLAASFLSTTVKSTFNNKNDKRDVTISATILDLVIDFLCKR